MLAFIRENNEEKLLCAFNVGNADVQWKSGFNNAETLFSFGGADTGGNLPVCSGYVAKLN